MLLAFSGAAPAETLVLSGSTTIQPVAERLATQFSRSNPDVDVQVSGGGSASGLMALIEGSTDIANSSKYISPAEQAMAAAQGICPVPFQIGYDCIVPVVHPGNPRRDLSLQALRAIYTGQATNWLELGGRDQEIVVVNRDRVSGTYKVWNDLVGCADGRLGG